MKTIIHLLFATVLFHHSAALAQNFTMTVATVAPADSPWSALLTTFKESVEKKTAGKVKVKLMLGGALGDENETVTKCSRGQIQAVAASTGALGSKVPELTKSSIRYLRLNLTRSSKNVDLF